eukprot:TRINITY_DN14816_c0_g1_i3.p1 TRINITY_DN14816_c0_g1~~TRINITY_DN14816_c0_g1_i3.p1  ORF type:complete len:600 (-),score=46.11 TRINITY_DN14816_c0_g1_i3:272-2071(-)
MAPRIASVMSQWRLRLSRCFPRIWSSDLHNADAEQAYKKYLAPQVARSTVAVHAIGCGCTWSFLLWSATVIDDSADSGEDGDARMPYVFIFALSFGLQSLLLLALLFVACFKRAEEVPWELTSIITTAVMVIMLPWLAASRTISSSGLEIMLMLYLTNVYTLYVPIRWRFWFIIPLFHWLSFVASLLFRGLSHRVALPFGLLSLMSLLAPAHIRRSHELLARNGWQAQEIDSQEKAELPRMQALSLSREVVELTFELTNSFRFYGSDRSRDNFFGNSVEGALFADLMSTSDRARFETFTASFPARAPDSITLRLQRQVGDVEVKLHMVEVNEMQARVKEREVPEFPQFLVNLIVMSTDLDQTSSTSPTSILPSFQPIVPGTPMSLMANEAVSSPPESCSEVSFSYSSDSYVCSNVQGRAGTLNSVTEALDLQRRANTRSTQTAEVAIAHSAVNTDATWRLDAFCCMACEKPPKLPGPPPIVPRRARKHRVKVQEQHKPYEGSEFDGDWTARDADAEKTASPLKRFVIEGAEVILGDLTTTTLLVDATSAECLLSLGAIWLDADGTLVRRGQSGRVVKYDRDDDAVSDDEYPTFASIALS